MKRILSLFLSMLLAFSQLAIPRSAMAIAIFGGGAAMEATLDAQFEENSIELFCVVDGKIYTYRVRINSIISLYNPEDKSEVPIFKLDSSISVHKMYQKDGLLMLVSSDGKQYACNPADASITEVENFPLNLDDVYIAQIHYLEGKPIFQMEDITGGNGFLYWADGSNKRISLPRERYFENLSIYKDGTFIGLSFDGIYLITENNVEKLSPDTQELIYDYGVFFYDAPSDKIYVSNGNYLYALDNTYQKTAMGFLPIILEGYSMWQYIDGKIYYLDRDGEQNSLEIFTLASLNLPTSLVKVTGLDSHLSNAYNKANPDFPIANTGYLDWSLAMDPAKLATSMKGQDAADVYFLDTNSISTALSKHGYAESLASSEILSTLHNRFYPYLQAATQYEGKPYFLPYDLNLSNTGFTYHIKGMEELGYKPEDLPKTYLEFIKFIKELESETEDSEYQIFDMENTVNLKIMLTTNVILELFGSQLRAGEKIQFNHPETIKILQDIFAIQFDRLNNGEEVDYSNMEFAPGKTALFGFTTKIAGAENGYAPLPLSIREGDAPLFLVNPRLAFVNSLSEKKAEGIKFLERFANVLEERIQTYLYTDKTEPVQDSNLLKYIEKQEKRLAQFKESIAANPNEKERKAAEQDLVAHKQSLENMRKNTYLISEEDLAFYKANVENYYILSQQLLNFSNEQQMSLIERFYNGQIDVATFLNELDRIVNMALLEAK